MQSIDQINDKLNAFLFESQKSLEKTYKVEEINNEEGKGISSILDTSHILPDYERATYIKGYRIEKLQENFKAYLINVLIDYRLRPSKFHSGDYSDLQWIGFIKINKCPRIFIKPESISDKIMDLFMKLEIDFRFHPEFSRNYYVITDNKKEASTKINRQFCNSVNKLKDAFVEIKDEYLMIKFKKDSPFKKVRIIASFLEEINNNKLLVNKQL
jgi:hypothetical protein